MATERKNISEVLLMAIAITSAIVLLDWLSFSAIISTSAQQQYSFIFGQAQKIAPTARFGFLVAICAEAYLSQAMRFQKPLDKRILALTGIITIPLFVRGYDPHAWVNTYVYPIAFMGSGLSLSMLIRSIAAPSSNEKEGILSAIPNGTTSDLTVTIPTDKGDLVIANPRQGIGIEGNAGAGKTKLTQYFLWKMIKAKWAGFIYDYEGNTNEGRAILCKTAYTALKKTPGSKVKFAMLNPSDFFRTVQCNPIAPRYFTSSLDITEAIHGLMKNLEKEWVYKNDFWSNNAMNIAEVTTYWLYLNRPDCCTLPHLTSIMLRDFRVIMEMLISDTRLAPKMAPVLSAYRLQAQSTTGSIISTSQLPLAKIYNPELYYLFAPMPGNDFDLNITNPDSPSIFCVCNDPGRKAALSPLLAVVSHTVKNQMMRANRVTSFYCIDENSTFFLPGQEELPAQGRKNGITSLFTWQTFTQMCDLLEEKKASQLRENLGTFFLGQNKNRNTSEYISMLMGEYYRTDLSYTTNDSGGSQTQSQRREKLMTVSDLANQPTGHYSGVVANGNPPIFSAQVHEFKEDLMDIPEFNNPFKTGNRELDEKKMSELIQSNFNRINRECDDIVAPFAELIETKDG